MRPSLSRLEYCRFLALACSAGLVILVSPTGFPALSAATQTPPTSSPRDICAIADSIAQYDTPLLQRFIDAADRRDPQSEATAGLAALQLGLETGLADHLGEASDHLQRAESAYEDDACFFYYRGLVRRELGTKSFFAAEVWARLRDRDNTELAIQDFRRASELRPDWLVPAVALSALSRRTFEGKPGRRKRWQSWAMEALDRYTESGGLDPAADLWRGRLWMEADSFAAAFSAFRRSWAGTNDRLALYDAARALFALERGSEATQAYWSALDGLADSALTAEVGYDIRFIFSPEEREEWEELRTGAGRAAWVRNFWARRAARDLVSEDERLAEHFARLRYAHEAYRRTSEAAPRLSTDQFDRPHDEILDDRGLVYIRMGEPDRVIPCLLEQRNVYRTWVYPDEGGGNAVVHFTPERKSEAWSLVTVLPSQCYYRLGSSITDYYMLAFRLESGDRLRTLEEGRRERDRAEAAAGAMLANDEHRLPLDRRLEFGFEWLFFHGHEPGSIEVTLAYAVPVEQLRCEDRETGRECDLQLRASIFGADTVVDRFDMAARPPVGGARDWILGHLRGRAAPGRWGYRVAAFRPLDPGSDDKVRGNITAGTFTVPWFLRFADPPQISVSSLVVAHPGPGSWERGQQAMALNPLHTYPPDATVDVYYEIYGLPEGQIFITEVTLLKEKDPPMDSVDPPLDWVQEVLEDKRPDLQLRFEESSARDGRPWLERRKTLSLTGIGEGEYTLVLTITSSEPSTTVYRLAPLVIDRRARSW
jgi:GWxTD domain-containing protein